MANSSSIHLSVVIPALNEAQRLGVLLDRLQAQTRPAEEIIIADAGSKDGTRELALSRGAVVVPGGLPGAGRNAGARVATGDLLLFLDADVLPPPDFIEKALSEFNKTGYGIATALIETIEEDLSLRVLAEATNLFLLVVQPFVPHAPGFCILVKREVHKTINGFDETARMAEDHDYVQRAAKIAGFGVLTSARISVSMRRLEKEGLVKLSLKYLWAEMHALAGKPVYSMPFNYEFGAHADLQDKTPQRWKLVDIAQLRKQIDRFENPLLRLSGQGVNRLAKIVSWENAQSLRERIRLALDLQDLNRLNRYLSRRLAFFLQSDQIHTEILRAGRSLFSHDSLDLVDPNWLGSQVGDEDETQKTEDTS
jgi:glycosyltransferase involved in cell wall biosynthesis